MLGRDLYKIEVDFELSNERLKSLIFFYEPLLGKTSVVIYEYLMLSGSRASFNELNTLLESLNLSIDTFEQVCERLNEFNLLKTLQKDNKYILVLCPPLTRKEFIKDDLLVRTFILKTSGKHYQELISSINERESHSEYKDISKTMELKLENWSQENEAYLNAPVKPVYNFNTHFDVSEFLKDISTNLLPMKFRTKENLYKLASIADLYSINYDTMRTFIPKVFNNDTGNFDVNKLEYYARNAKIDYHKVNNDQYDVPCKLYLMSLQDGKEVSEYDLKLIYKLSNEYHLRPSVINVILEHSLRNCDNRLIEKYVCAIASDLHRNNIETSLQALERLDKYNGNRNIEQNVPNYDTSKNDYLSEEELNKILDSRGKND